MTDPAEDGRHRFSGLALGYARFSFLGSRGWVLAVPLVAALGALTFRYSRTFRDLPTLYTVTLSRNSRSRHGRQSRDFDCGSGDRL